MDKPDWKPVLGAAALLFMVCCFIYVSNNEFKEERTGIISDPEKNERITGLLEKACMNTGYECRHLVAGQ